MHEVSLFQVIENSSEVPWFSQGYFNAYVFHSVTEHLVCGAHCLVLRAKSVTPIENKHVFV